MKVLIEARPRFGDVGECLKKASVEAIMDEAVRIPGHFTSELFHPGPWGRFKACCRPEADVEFSAGGVFIARGLEDYLRFAESILSIGTMALGMFPRVLKLARLTGAELWARPAGGGLRVSFAGFSGEVRVSDEAILFASEGGIGIPLVEFLEAERKFLSSLTSELDELFELCANNSLERAFLENTRNVRLLMKVVVNEGQLVDWSE